MIPRRRWEHLLSLGSNVDPDRWVPRALDLARARFDLTATSEPYDVEAVGAAADSPAFVNMALRVRTDLPFRALREACRRIEEACGRVRQADRNAPRTLDLDVVYSRVSGEAPVRVHPDLVHEAYVLVPCADVWPDAPLPGDDAQPVTVGERAAAIFPGWRDAHRRSG